ncbi:MAG TPA: isoprenylcysteine carboxylmethyltransferase family protein [Candidatus Paceibacterota bacterium]|nr:isoprenylcysteine carboxylmethyltransferase family protein [Candidatus Paceibacterota bacterium]
METPLKDRVLYFGANLLLVWLAVFVYFLNAYYQSFLLPGTKLIVLGAALLYTAYFPLYLLFHTFAKPSKGYLILRGLRRLLPWTALAPGEERRLSHEEKTALLFFVVKFYFLPLMINFAAGNFQGAVGTLSQFDPSRLLEASYFIAVTYPLLILLIFFIDTFYFAFGYLFESDKLDNTVRSVEPTVLGWVSALLCYPPFNSAIMERFFPWYPSLYGSFGSLEATLIAYLAILGALFIYLWGTLALGTKCSNLTNRGIVSHGPYAWIRHPHYASKNLAWWIALLPVMSVAAFISMLAWSAVYFVRAWTEERHLLADPEYQAYVQKVRYRFIPGVY